MFHYQYLSTTTGIFYVQLAWHICGILLSAGILLNFYIFIVIIITIITIIIIARMLFNIWLWTSSHRRWLFPSLSDPPSILSPSCRVPCTTSISS